MATIGWVGILRLGLVQTALGAVVVLMTSTINRVMVVELALPAVVPGLLIGSHHAIQILRPAWGYGSDIGGRRTPWIIGGMAALTLGGFGAAASTALTAADQPLGLILAATCFLAVGAGAGAAGTSVLAMLASTVAPERRAAAAATVWVMMIFGFAITAPLAGYFLDPFSQARLIAVTGSVCAVAFLVATIVTVGLETGLSRSDPLARPAFRPPFREALAQVWREPAARRFTVFIFVSMLAYGGQELLIEPYAGLVFGMTPGATTTLAGLQHGGVLLGMLGVGLGTTAIGGPILGSIKVWTVGGCLASAAALVAIAVSGHTGNPGALRAAIFGLGVSNGAFAVAAISAMMSLAGGGPCSREGTRLGLWGAAQALAFCLGGFVGTLIVAAVRSSVANPAPAYDVVFLVEAALFIASGALASWSFGERPTNNPANAAGETRLAKI